MSDDEKWVIVKDNLTLTGVTYVWDKKTYDLWTTDAHGLPAQNPYLEVVVDNLTLEEAMAMHILMENARNEKWKV